MAVDTTYDSDDYFDLDKYQSGSWCSLRIFQKENGDRW